MKKLGMYSMKDNESNHYDTPFFAYDDVQAKRRFIMAINNEQTMVSQFKNSFELKKLGVFDVETGEMEKSDELILRGSEVEKLEKE